MVIEEEVLKKQLNLLELPKGDTRTVFIRPYKDPEAIPEWLQEATEVNAQAQANGAFKRTVRPFTGVFFPGVTERICPRYDMPGCIRAWTFAGTDEDLKKYVEILKLKDQDGNLITYANRFDPNDAFFVHKSHEYLVQEGYLETKLSDMGHRFLLTCLQQNHEFADLMNGDRIEEGSGVKYLITFSKQDVSLKTTKASVYERASRLLEKMRKDSKYAAEVASILIPDYTSYDEGQTMDVLTVDWAMNTAKMYDSGRTYQEMFISVAGSEREELALKATLKKASDLQLLTFGKGGVIFRDIVIASSMEEAVEYFKDRANHDQLQSLINLTGKS